MITMRYTAAQINDQFPEARSLTDLFQAFEKKTQLGGQVVCQFRVNNLNFSEHDEARAKDMKIEELEVLEVLVDTPTNLLASVVMNWIDDLPRLVTKVDEMCAAVRDGGLQSQYTPLVKMIDNCQFLTDSLVSIRSFAVAADMVTSPEWEANEAAMAKAVGETLQAFEQKDSNWLADVIEYDLATCLLTWHQLLQRLHEHLAKNS